ncbi:hypothetical protein H9P43_008774 [Blastocladiella emersonii ATCC 22665]|nr:hypothetical protein H9P43_008774 [Blastocladiella emersonii ATCC 22665]
MAKKSSTTRKPSTAFLAAAAAAVALVGLAATTGVSASPVAKATSPLLVPNARKFVPVSIGEVDIDVEARRGGRGGRKPAPKPKPAPPKKTTTAKPAPPKKTTTAAAPRKTTTTTKATPSTTKAATRGVPSASASASSGAPAVTNAPVAGDNNNGGGVNITVNLPIGGGSSAPEPTETETDASEPTETDVAEPTATATEPADAEPTGTPDAEDDAGAAPAGRAVVYEQVIDIAAVQPGAKNIFWSRLHFDASKTKLRAGAAGAKGFGENLPGDILRITSLADDGVQYLNAETLAQWKHRSAVFNGGKVKVELLADPAAPAGEKPSVVVSQLETNTQDGYDSNKVTLPPPASLCTAADERKASSDARSARIFPVGCTAWTITDKNGCHVTAGHCFDGTEVDDQIIQINVPQSAVITTAGQKTAILRHPHPKYQFAVDAESVQFNLTELSDGDKAEDWAYFGSFPNPNTGLTHRETVGGKAYTLAKVDESTCELVPGQVKVGDTATIYGYGFVTAAARKQMSQVQQVASGKVVDFPNKFHIRHRADTEGGNSGSSIEVGGVAVGIHTNGGCTTWSARSANTGSLVSMPAFQRAIKNPKGVCKA